MKPLHPYAWWIWAIAAAICASRTRNPLGLVLIGAAVLTVAVQRRREGSGTEAVRIFVRFGLVVIALRVLLTIILGATVGNSLLFELPSVPLPDWMAGLEIGGAVYLEAVVAAFYEGLRLAVILLCFGAVNALVSPYRLLRALPQALHEAGVAVSIGLTLAPQLVVEAGRVRRARRLRGRPTGLKGIRGTIMPVLEGALEGAAHNAASMDSRGYGRTGAISANNRLAALWLGGFGLVAAAVASYGTFAPDSPRYFAPVASALAASCLGSAIWLAGSGSVRTVHRPDVWGRSDWMVSGAAVLAAVVFRAAANGAEIAPGTVPLVWPEVGGASVVAAFLLISPIVTTAGTVTRGRRATPGGRVVAGGRA
jgi:energy-coupling factor transport system permease protein